MSRLVLLALFFFLASALVPAALAYDPISYGALKVTDFHEKPPPKTPDRKEDAETASGSIGSYSWSISADNQITVNPPEYQNLFDPNKSWFDSSGLTKEQVQKLLNHEQGHFDISEIYNRQLQAAAEQIKKEMQDGINGDPQDKKTFLDNDQQIDNLMKELDKTKDPEKKKELQMKIDDLTQQNIGLLKKHSSTEKNILQNEADEQEDYDTYTSHGTNDENQQKANKDNKKQLEDLQQQSSAPRANSQANHTIHFDAATGRLTLSDDFITSTDLGRDDPIVGSRMDFSVYHLAGTISWGDPIFTPLGSAGAMSMLSPAGDTLLTGNIPYLIYDIQDNQLFGFVDSPAFSASNLDSIFLSSLKSQLDSPSWGQLGIQLNPSQNLYSGTQDFTSDFSTPFDNVIAETYATPEPSAWILSGLGMAGLLLWHIMRGRKKRHKRPLAVGLK